MAVAVGPLVERDGEIARLRQGIALARTGDGRAIVIQGGAGIGKTALLRATVTHACESGMTVLEASAGTLEREFPFGVARRLFERLLRTASETERERLLEGAAGLAAPALGIEAVAGPPADPTFGPLHGLYWLVANLSTERPLVLAVDDVQWADEGSLRFLLYLGRRLGDLPVLLLATRRTGEPEAEPELLAELVAGTDAELVAPAPLSAVGTEHLLGAELGESPSPALVDRIHGATAGNPFLLRELAREVTDGDASLAAGLAAPASVARAIVTRLRRLGPAVVALADATVILGDGCSLAETRMLAGLGADETAEAAASMVRAELLAREEALRFVHPLVRGAIESEMTPSERAERHARAAKLLMRRGAARDRIVAQLLAGAPGEDPEAVVELRGAGREALARGAPQAAARYLRRALEEAPAEDGLGELLTDLGVALVLTDRPDEAEPLLSRARRLATDPTTLADRTLKLWIALLAAAKIDDGVAAIEATIARLGDGDEEREAVLMLEGEFVTAALFDPDRLRATWRRLEPFEQLSGRTPAERRLLSMVTAKSQYAVGHSADELAEIARRSYGDGRLIAENPLDPTKWVWGIGALVIADRVEESEVALGGALASARVTGSLETLVMVDNLRALLALRLGRLEDAEADAFDGLGRLLEIEATPPRELLRVALVRWAVPAMVARGRVEAADRLLTEHGLDGELGGGAQHAKLYRERGLLRLMQGRTEDALEDALHLAEIHRRHEIEDIAEAPWRPVAALAQARLGNPEAAMTIADEHLLLARRWGLARDVGAALRVRALAEPGNERRLDLLRQSLTTLKPAPAPLETAETQAELGRAMLRAGRRTEAREALGQALDGATRCGAATLAAAVREELKVAGARPRRALVSGVDALTAAERRSAEMAASGLTNREIAQALFLSVRTVENSLGRVYRKLGIGSRRDLGRALDAAPQPGLNR